MRTRSDYRLFADEGNSETGSDYEETTKSEKNFPCMNLQLMLSCGLGYKTGLHFHS
jgi:hypothetical protein